MARHSSRPQAIDYIGALFTDFIELSGDRLYAEDAAIIAGLAKFNDQPVVVIGQQKGRDTAEKSTAILVWPDRKVSQSVTDDGFSRQIQPALDDFCRHPRRLPGIGAEERGQSGAIGRCLYRSFTLRAPILATVIGEGGSGGALALAAGDYLGMLRYSIYSVISPEGAASILWKDASARLTPPRYWR